MNRRLQLQLVQRRRLLMSGDVLAVLLSVFIALVLRAFSSRLTIDGDYFRSQAFWFLFFAVIWLVLANANDLYRRPTDWRPTRVLLRLTRVTLQILLLYLVVFFLAERDELPRLFMLYFGVVSTLLLTIWRLLWPTFSDWTSEARRVMIVGEGDGVRLMTEAIEQHAADSYRVVAAPGAGELSAADDADALTNRALQLGVSDVVVTATQELDEAALKGIMEARVAGLNVLPMPVLYERITGRVPLVAVGDNWSVLLPLDGADIRPWPLLKSALDILLAIPGVLALILLLPLLGLAIRLDSRGSIFYTQERVGRNGRVFRILKFRTMVTGAEQGTGAVFARGDDPRITRVGGWLRRTHLDELPQVINILRGEMSLVGPRPERPEHVEQLAREIPFYRVRLMMLPGLTGWAQVHQGYAAGVAETWVKLQYDLYYVRHHSFLLDLEILLRTAGRVLDSRAWRKGAAPSSMHGAG